MATASMVSSGKLRSVEQKPALVRVAILCDFAEERWLSMDLVGDMLYANLREHFADRFLCTLIRPRLPFAGSKPSMALRLFGRFVHYPREIRQIRRQFDLFHIVDHSYAHLGHELPPERTVVTCHDIDAFRCLLQPGTRHSWAHRLTARRVLAGLQRAAYLTCDSGATRADILKHDLFPAERLSVVHNGVHPALSAEPEEQADAELSRLIGRAPGVATELIHVGSTIPRKRIDTLLNVLSRVRQQRPGIRLLRVGGAFTPQQRQLAQSLGILGSIDVLPQLEERLLAAAYRRSALLLQTSEAEGFGLPVIEAMACGTPVIASDIAVLREVGGSFTVYCAVGDTERFSDSVVRLLAEREHHPDAWNTRRANCLTQSSQFSWSRYAEKMVEIYDRVLTK